jgi:hypothetical protein
MNRWTLLAMAAGTASVGAARYMSDPPVNLQAATPGLAQSGHINITGTAKAGFFKGDGGQLTGLNAAAMNMGILTLTGTSSTYIIRGSNDSGDPNATGVIGLANSPTGVTYGGWFESKSASGRALFGYASAATGATYGLYGVAAGNGGRAIFGLANHASGNTYGGWFQTNSPDGIGAYARNIAGGIGLRAESSGVALECNGAARFSQVFHSIGPRTTAHGINELFGVSSNLTDWTGMYVTSGSGGSPYYGYNNVAFDAYTYLDANGNFNIITGAATTIGRFGNLNLLNSDPSAIGINLTNSGTGKGFNVNMSNTSTFADGITVTQTGFGQGIGVLLTNAGVGARGISVDNAGVGFGVYATSKGNTGVEGDTNSISAAGVIGRNLSLGEAVVGFSSGTGGVGAVVGRTDGVGGYGVRGFGTHDNSYGVYGQHGISGSLNGYGVRGDIMTANGTGIGVYAKATGASQIALYAEGKFTATGTKAFLIDHPQDPANKMLYHYCTEGNQPLNAYSGNARTDDQGTAWVTLPSYVEDINKDFRYQLTVIGSFAQAIIGQ